MPNIFLIQQERNYMLNKSRGSSPHPQSLVSAVRFRSSTKTFIVVRPSVLILILIVFLVAVLRLVRFFIVARQRRTLRHGANVPAHPPRTHLKPLPSQVRPRERIHGPPIVTRHTQRNPHTRKQERYHLAYVNLPSQTRGAGVRVRVHVCRLAEQDAVERARLRLAEPKRALLDGAPAPAGRHVREPHLEERAEPVHLARSLRRAEHELGVRDGGVAAIVNVAEKLDGRVARAVVVFEGHIDGRRGGGGVDPRKDFR